MSQLGDPPRAGPKHDEPSCRSKDIGQDPRPVRASCH
jgi:hypothetical protein